MLAGFVFVTSLVIIIGGEISLLLSDKISELYTVNKKLNAASDKIKKISSVDALTGIQNGYIRISQTVESI